MQPYFFPYLAYYQLYKCVDEFIFLDDANFIKKGFINRNNIIVDGSEYRFTLSVKEMSQNKSINEHDYVMGSSTEKFLNTISFNYKKSMCFDEINDLIKGLLLNH